MARLIVLGENFTESTAFPLLHLEVRRLVGVGNPLLCLLYGAHALQIGGYLLPRIQPVAISRAESLRKDLNSTHFVLFRLH